MLLSSQQHGPKSPSLRKRRDRRGTSGRHVVVRTKQATSSSLVEVNERRKTKTLPDPYPTRQCRDAIPYKYMIKLPVSSPPKKRACIHQAMDKREKINIIIVAGYVRAVPRPLYVARARPTSSPPSEGGRCVIRLRKRSRWVRRVSRPTWSVKRCSSRLFLMLR